MEVIEGRIELAYLNTLFIEKEALIEGLVDIAADCERHLFAQRLAEGVPLGPRDRSLQ